MTKELALASAKEVAAYLKKKHGATRVLLFGSLVEDRFRPQSSDIDIYFEGVDRREEGYVAGKTFLDFDHLCLDLIPSGIAPAHLKEEILKTGVAL